MLYRGIWITQSEHEHDGQFVVWLDDGCIEDYFDTLAEAQACVDNGIDWVQEAKDYAEFLGWDEEDFYQGNDQATAKQWLQEAVEHIIAINGTGELFETELDILERLNIKEEEYV